MSREQYQELVDNSGDGWRRLSTPASSSPVLQAARGGGREAQDEQCTPRSTWKREKEQKEHTQPQG